MRSKPTVGRLLQLCSAYVPIVFFMVGCRESPRELTLEEQRDSWPSVVLSHPKRDFRFRVSAAAQATLDAAECIHVCDDRCPCFAEMDLESAFVVPSQGDANRICMLTLAVNRECDSCVHALLEAGAPISRSDRYWSPLHAAVAFGLPEFVRAMLARDPDALNALDGSDRCPMSHAIRAQQPETLGVLLEFGADPNEPLGGEFGQLPLATAARHDSDEVWRLLMDHPDIDPTRTADSYPTPVHSSLAHPDRLRELIKRGAPMNVPSGHQFRETPLLELFRLDYDGKSFEQQQELRLESMQILLEAGADPLTEDSVGRNALYRAEKQQNEAAYELLMRYVSPGG
ncbi:MAG: ankyrin repeat domain-containing protein [Planctomycetota bacterium]